MTGAGSGKQGASEASKRAAVALITSLRCQDEREGGEAVSARLESFMTARLLFHPQSLAARKSRIESAPESRRLDAFDHDQIIILPLQAGRGKVRGAGAQQSAI